MVSVLWRESSIQHALRTRQCVARTSIDSFRPLQMLSQIQRILIFHPLCSNPVQSYAHIRYLLPDRISVGGATAGETPAFPCPRLARVPSPQRAQQGCWLLRGVVRLRSAGSSMSAPAAHIVARSRITAAVIAIAQSVRSLLANGGLPHVNENCSPRATCTWSSPSPATWPQWCCRTKR